MESKQNETFVMIFLGPEDIPRAWSACQESHEAATRTVGAPPPLWAPRDSTELFLPPIYSQISQNLPGEPRNNFSTAATFYTCEIPSGAFSGTLPEGDSITEGFYINTIALPMKHE